MCLLDEGHNVRKGADVLRAKEAPMEGVKNFPFGEPHWAIRIIRLPNLLQKPGKACPKLYSIGVSRFFGGHVYGGGYIIQCHRRITYQEGLSVCLIPRRKARDVDTVSKNYQRHVHQKNDAEAALHLLQQFLLAEISSLWCQGGRMWVSDDDGVNGVQMPGRAYSRRADEICIFFEQLRIQVICGGCWGEQGWALLSCKERI